MHLDAGNQMTVPARGKILQEGNALYSVVHSTPQNYVAAITAVTSTRWLWISFQSRSHTIDTLTLSLKNVRIARKRTVASQTMWTNPLAVSRRENGAKQFRMMLFHYS